MFDCNMFFSASEFFSSAFFYFFSAFFSSAVFPAHFFAHAPMFVCLLFRQIRDKYPSYTGIEIKTLATQMYEKHRYQRKCLRSLVVAEKLGGCSSASEVDAFCKAKGWVGDHAFLKQRTNHRVRAVSNILNKNRLTTRDLDSRKPETAIQVFKMLFF